MKPTNHSSLSWRQIIYSNWFIPLVSVFILILLLSLRLIANADIGFHLRGGQWMIEHRAFHGYDVFTYTVNQHEYVAMYWLYQFIIYGVYRSAGYVGISLCNTILIAGLFVIVFSRMKTSDIPLGVAAVLLMISAWIIELRFSVRPEIITWLFVAGELWLLDRYFHYQKKLLFLLPVFQLCWTNFHGLFILGWIITGAYFISMILRRRSLDRYFAMWFVIAILVSFINPYFAKGFFFPLKLLATLQPAGPFKDFIAEFVSPWLLKATPYNPFIPIIPLYLYYAMVMISCLLVTITFKHRSFHEYVLIAAFIYISSTAIRNIPLFVIVAVHINAVSMRDLWRLVAKKWKPGKHIKFLSRIPAYVFTGLIILFCLRIITNAYYISNRRETIFGVGLDPNAHPAGAAAFIVDNELNGRILNDLNTGSWLTWTIPQPVFIDGRLEVMGAEFFKEAIESFSENGLMKLVNKYKPALIVFNHTQTYQWAYQLNNMPAWRLIYLDGTSAIYAHQDYAPNLPQKEISEIAAAQGIEIMMPAADVWRLLKTPKKSAFALWLEGFCKKQEYPHLFFKLGKFAFLSGTVRDAESFYLAFLKQSNAKYFEVFANLGYLYFQTGDYEKAYYCFKQLPRAHVDALLSN